MLWRAKGEQEVGMPAGVEGHQGVSCHPGGQLSLKFTESPELLSFQGAELFWFSLFYCRSNDL